MAQNKNNMNRRAKAQAYNSYEEKLARMELEDEVPDLIDENDDEESDGTGDENNEEKKTKNNDGTIRKKPRYWTKTKWCMITIKAEDGYFEDTEENMTILIRDVCEELQGTSWKGCATIENDILDWFPYAWMHFDHWHGHIFMDVPLQEKKDLKEYIKGKLYRIMGPNRFNLGWMVFGKNTPKQRLEFLNYVNKQRHPKWFINSTNEDYQWHNNEKKFDIEKVGQFIWGDDIDTKRFQAARVLEKELAKKDMRWSGTYKPFYFRMDNTNIHIHPEEFLLGFSRVKHYKTFVQKAFSAVEFVIKNPHYYLPRLYEEI